MREQRFMNDGAAHVAAVSSVHRGNLIAGIIIGVLFAVGCLVFIIVWGRERKDRVLPDSLKDALDLSWIISFIGVPIGLAVAIVAALHL